MTSQLTFPVDSFQARPAKITTAFTSLALYCKQGGFIKKVSNSWDGHFLVKVI